MAFLLSRNPLVATIRALVGLSLLAYGLLGFSAAISGTGAAITPTAYRSLLECKGDPVPNDGGCWSLRPGKVMSSRQRLTTYFVTVADSQGNREVELANNSGFAAFQPNAPVSVKYWKDSITALGTDLAALTPTVDSPLVHSDLLASSVRFIFAGLIGLFLAGLPLVLRSPARSATAGTLAGDVAGETPGSRETARYTPPQSQPAALPAPAAPALATPALATSAWSAPPAAAAGLGFAPPAAPVATLPDPSAEQQRAMTPTPGAGAAAGAATPAAAVFAELPPLAPASTAAATPLPEFTVLGDPAPDVAARPVAPPVPQSPAAPPSTQAGAAHSVQTPAPPSLQADAEPGVLATAPPAAAPALVPASAGVTAPSPPATAPAYPQPVHWAAPIRPAVAAQNIAGLGLYARPGDVTAGTSAREAARPAAMTAPAAPLEPAFVPHLVATPAPALPPQPQAPPQQPQAPPQPQALPQPPPPLPQPTAASPPPAEAHPEPVAAAAMHAAPAAASGTQHGFAPRVLPGVPEEITPAAPEVRLQSGGPGWNIRESAGPRPRLAG